MKSHFLHNNPQKVTIRYDADCVLCSLAIKSLTSRDVDNLIEAEGLPNDIDICDRKLEFEMPNQKKVFGFFAILAALDCLGYRRTVRFLNLWPVRSLMKMVYKFLSTYRYRFQLLKSWFPRR